MAYRLKKGKLSPKAVRAIAAEQIARAHAALTADTVGPAGVHEGRKAVKRLRALLRLIEPAMAKPQFATLYKDIGRVGDLLAGARERHVLEETVRKLELHCGLEAAGVLAPLKNALQSKAHGHTPHLDPKNAAAIRQAFARQGRKFSKLQVKSEGFAAIEGGLEGTYRAARRNFARAYRHPDDEHFHDLRKTVQWHWRHMALLSRAWPAYFSMRIAAAHELAEALGDDHDLSMLIAEAQGLEALRGEAGAAAIQLARKRQQDLRNEAYALTERLFAERPRAFVKRIKSYWQAKRPIVSATAPGAAVPAANGDDLV